MKTLSFSATCGVNAGYSVENTEHKAIEALVQEIAQKHFDTTGVYVGAVVKPAKVVYSTAWGCPIGGEAIFVLEGTCNPRFTAVEKYRETVIAVMSELSMTLGQSTAQVTFVESELHYICN